MHPRIQELLHYLDAQRALLQAAVESVPAAQRATQPHPEGWSVAGVLEHLAQVETTLSRLFDSRLAEAKSRGIGPETETSPQLASLGMEGVLDRGRRIEAPPAMQPQTGLGAAAAWAALETAGAAFRRALLAGDGLALGELVHPHAALGLFNFYQWAAFVGAHEARHAAQIREIAAALDKA